jgi:hypothetical protein
MVRVIGSIVAGWAVFLLLGWLSNLLVLQFWPAYSAVFPERAFTLPMQLMRLAIGAALVIAAGWTVSALSRQNRPALLWCAITALIATVWVHLHEPTWSHYPVWYHFVSFCIPVPFALCGAWLHHIHLKRRDRNAG